MKDYKEVVLTYYGELKFALEIGTGDRKAYLIMKEGRLYFSDYSTARFLFNEKNDIHVGIKKTFLREARQYIQSLEERADLLKRFLNDQNGKPNADEMRTLVDYESECEAAPNDPA